jgi:hypothetical protein
LELRIFRFNILAFITSTSLAKTFFMKATATRIAFSHNKVKANYELRIFRVRIQIDSHHKCYGTRGLRAANGSFFGSSIKITSRPSG